MTTGRADWAPRAEGAWERRKEDTAGPSRDAGLAAGSLALHLVLLAAFLSAPTPKASAPPRERRVDVQILSPADFRALLPTPEPEPVLPLPALTMPPGLPLIPAPEVSPPAQPLSLPDRTIVARRFLATEVLADPRSAEARAALGQMLPDERLVQLCAVEALAQVAAVDERLSPDLLASYAMQDLSLRGRIVEAPGAAFRSGGAWYKLSFVCGLSDDLETVAHFEFRLGAPIPREDWDAHNLVSGGSMDHH